MSIMVRRATPADLPFMRQLYQAWRCQQPAYPRLDADEEGRFLAAWEDQFVDPSGRRAAWVAYHDGCLVGFMDGDLKARRFGQPKFYVFGSSLWVDPTARHLGIATLLVAACTEWLHGFGLDVLEMDEDAGTKGAWSRRGWAQREVATSYWADLGMLRRELFLDRRRAA